uniref:Uncharacterized protein n=1 Tax=Wuchereria bancrofti TaxID=6293 RepID=A0AAF5PQY1_WUCBA
MRFPFSLYDVMENESSDDNSDESCRWDGGRAEGVSSHISRPLSHPLMAMTILKLLMSRAVEEIVQLEALFIIDYMHIFGNHYLWGNQQLLSSEMQQPPNSAQHCENPPFCCLLFSS